MTERHPKLVDNDLMMVDCPNCEEPWQIAADDDDEQLYVYCQCYGKDPEPISKWVGRFMKENYDDDTVRKGYQ